MYQGRAPPGTRGQRCGQRQKGRGFSLSRRSTAHRSLPPDRRRPTPDTESGIPRMHGAVELAILPWYTDTKEKPMRVAELMQTDLSTVPPDAPVADVVQAMADGHVSGLPVVDSDGRVLGVVSATDVLQAAAEHDDRKGRSTLFEHTTARDIMTSGAITIEPDADVRAAAQRMLYGEVRRLFVVDAGRLVGVVSQTDIAHAMGSGRL